MVEAIAADPTRKQIGKSIHSRGYGDTSIPDLMADYRDGEDRSFAWISYNLHKTYPAVIWGLRLLMAGERFDVPQAGLSDVPLHEVFSWAYAHFILEDELKDKAAPPSPTDERPSLTRRVLQHALAGV
ncbi:MAG: hypothetical protein CVU38_04575 [Chloroflexi bacterium HGW-Chloroflexi-1]|nr:MAG: hypothetical protein CVU38_04575 [Chloroflexi bacterium HGW-Chloroflexi-1]